MTVRDMLIEVGREERAKHGYVPVPNTPWRCRCGWPDDAGGEHGIAPWEWRSRHIEAAVLDAQIAAVPMKPCEMCGGNLLVDLQLPNVDAPINRGFPLYATGPCPDCNLTGRIPDLAAPRLAIVRQVDKVWLRPSGLVYICVPPNEPVFVEVDGDEKEDR